MGIGTEQLKPEHISLIIDFYNEVELSIKNKSDLDIQKVVHQLVSFIYSNEFKFFLFEEFWFIKQLFPFCDIISIYEMKENFLSLKLFILVFEEIKKDRIKFKETVQNIWMFFERILTGNIDPKDSDFFGKIEINENSQKAIQEIGMYIKNNSKHIKVILNLIQCIFIYNFKDEFKELFEEYNNTFPNIDNGLIECFYKFSTEVISNVNKINVLKGFFNYILNIEELISLIENFLMKFDSSHLNYTKNIYYAFFLASNLKKNEKEIKETIDDKFIEYYNKLIINDKLIWTLYEEDTKSNLNKKEYLKTILEGNMTKKEKLKFDFLDNIYKINENQKIKGITGDIYKSIFYTNKIILLIKFDFEFFINKKISLDKIKNGIKTIQKLCPKEYNNLNIYAQIENKLINLDDEFDLFINELKNKNIIENVEININKINIPKEKEKVENNKYEIKNNELKVNNKESEKEEFKEEKLKLKNQAKTKESLIETINEKDKEIKELKLKLSKIPFNKNENEINELKIKIKNLEEELAKEKNKNEKSEKIILNLKKDLLKEAKKFEDLKKEIEEDKILKKKLEKEAKESFIETIIEKDKEIKELKIKLSRLPFTLEEGERLITIIFISSDQKLHFSVICKNTEKFHKIEGQLYESYPEYSENDNFFILNGRKINRYKSLEENGIKNNDIIILNEIV